MTLLLHCTQKVLKEFSITPPPLLALKDHDQFFFDWYCNLVYFDKKKSLLMTNQATLFSFLIFDIKRKDLPQLTVLFKDNLASVLLYEGFRRSTITQLLDAVESITFSKTGSKRVLGSMTDMALHIEYLLDIYDNSHHERINTIINQINIMPMKIIGYKRPLDAFSHYVEEFISHRS